MCEKPLAMTTEESSDLVRLAKASDRVTGVNYNFRFYPMNLEAKERTRSGELGEIHSIFGSYQQDWLLYDTDYNWRVLAEEQGELRSVVDIGTHWIDLAQNIVGQKVVLHAPHRILGVPSQAHSPSHRRWSDSASEL